MITISKISNNIYNIYQGNHINNIPNGYGILQTNEFIYNGIFLDGKFNDYGKITYHQDINIYNNQDNNQIINNKNDNIKKNNKYDKYNKTIKKNNKIDNQEICNEDKKDISYNTKKNLSNEDKKEISYEGYFKNDNREGDGKIYYSNGNIYIGTFLNNKKNGNGKEYNKDGKLLYSCKWLNGKCIDKTLIVEYHKNNKKMLEGYIEDDKKIGLWKYYDENEIIIKLEWHEEEIITLEINKNSNILLSFDEYLKDINLMDIKIDIINENIKEIKNMMINFLKKIKDNILDEDEYMKLKKLSLQKNTKYIILLKNNFDFDYIKINNTDKIIIKKYNNDYIIKYSSINNNKLDEKYNNNNILLSIGIFNKHYKLQEGKIFLNGLISKEGLFNSESILINGKIYENGVILYEGKLQMNNYHDLNGKLYKDGILIYEGGFVNGLKHGFGTLYNEQLLTLSYVGNWYNDMRHGNGVLYDELGDLIISGNFENNNLI